MKEQQLLRPNAGFTLIETMFALVILSISLLALAGLQVTALRGNALSRRMTTAVSIAEQKIEQLKDTPFANIQAESPTQVTVSNLHFTRQVTITNNSPLANSMTVSVSVSWKDGATTHTVPMATVISQ